MTAPCTRTSTVKASHTALAIPVDPAGEKSCVTGVFFVGCSRVIVRLPVDLRTDGQKRCFQLRNVLAPGGFRGLNKQGLQLGLERFEQRQDFFQGAAGKLGDRSPATRRWPMR